MTDESSEGNYMDIDCHFLFYTDTQPLDSTIALNISETYHAVNVLRVQQSDPICITDGNGTIFLCTCSGFHEKRLIAAIQETHNIQRRSSIHLLVGLPERDAFELLLTECTALGVSRITPVIAVHCQRAWWKPSWNKHYNRFRAKMIVSMKQALYPFLPQLCEPVTLIKSIGTTNNPILIAESDGNYLDVLKNSINLNNITCYIGPPGGFSRNEIDLVLQHGGQKVKIGESRLRTELASVALCAQLAAFT